MPQPVVPLTEFDFSAAHIRAAADQNRLLTLEIELSLRCNFRCPYCYVPRDEYFRNELTRAEIEDVIHQAQGLGARRIIILGGEPTIDPRLPEIIEFIRRRELEAEVFTNGSGLTAELARTLSAANVRVVLKMNSFDAAIQDRLAGKAGAAQMIAEALKRLKRAGYPGPRHFLAVSSVICRPNLEEIPRLWCWLRDQHIVPYFEIITPQENARDNQWLHVPVRRLREVFEALARIDRQQYGREWSIQPPLVGNKCLRHLFSCLVTSVGEVRPCVGVTLGLGNIRTQPLADIIAGSQVLRDLKNHRQTIKGPCGRCERAEHCYGCRGAAFQLTGDYLASDPLCWNIADPRGGCS